MSDKRKHSRGFNENVEDTRAQRVSFKLYLRELEEVTIDENIHEDENELPEDLGGISAFLNMFMNSCPYDTLEDARMADTEHDAVDMLVDELLTWLQHEGNSKSDASNWIKKFTDEIYDYFASAL